MMKQLLYVTAMNLRSLRLRFWSSMVIVIGMAGVVGVFVSLLAMSKRQKPAAACAHQARHRQQPAAPP